MRKNQVSGFVSFPQTLLPALKQPSTYAANLHPARPRRRRYYRRSWLSATTTLRPPSVISATYKKPHNKTPQPHLRKGIAAGASSWRISRPNLRIQFAFHVARDEPQLFPPVRQPPPFLLNQKHKPPDKPRAPYESHLSSFGRYGTNDNTAACVTIYNKITTTTNNNKTNCGHSPAKSSSANNGHGSSTSHSTATSSGLFDYWHLPTVESNLLSPADSFSLHSL